MSLNSQPYQFISDSGLDVGVSLAGSGQLPLNALAGALCGLSIGVIIIYAMHGCLLSTASNRL